MKCYLLLAVIFKKCITTSKMCFSSKSEATATIQRLNSDNASGASAAAGAAEAESRQLKEELAILHKVVAGRSPWLVFTHRLPVEIHEKSL